MNQATSPKESQRFLVLLLTMGLGYAAYFVLRFGGLWSENDTSVFANVTAKMLQAGSVLFSGQYVHGYGYPAWLGSLSLVTGISVPVFNIIVAPFIGVLFLVFLTYLAYRQWLKTSKLAALAVLLLFGSPDLLFGAMRGNHEKLTLILSLAAFYALMRGSQAMGERNLWQYGAWAVVLYLCVFTDATVNDYFASTFVVATAVAMVVGSWLARRGDQTFSVRPVFRRVATVVGASWLLILWVMFFVFTPAGSDFQLLKTAGSKLLSLFVTLDTGSNPYTLASAQWANAAVVGLVAAFRWAASVASFLIWIGALWQIIVQRKDLEWSRLLLIALYGAFGLTVAVAIPMDFTGLAAGANLEVRNFTLFVLFASPLLVWGLSEGPAHQVMIIVRKYRSLVGTVIAIIFAGFVIIGLLKVTLDPIISNQWMFYRPSEKQAVGYFWAHGVDASLWTGPDNRIPDMWATWNTSTVHGNSVLGYALVDTERDWLRSPLVVASTVVEGMVVPNYQAQDRVYDNGDSQLYHMRPLTPFQS